MSLILETPFYSEINDFSNIRPAALLLSSNSGKQVTFLFDFSPKFSHFRTYSRYRPGGLQAE